MSDFSYDVYYYICQDGEKGKFDYLDCDTYLQAARFFKYVLDEFSSKINEKTEWFIELGENRAMLVDEKGNIWKTYTTIKKKEGNI